MPHVHDCCCQCHHPCTRPLLTHTLTADSYRQVWLSLLWELLLFSLHPNEHNILFVPSKNLWQIWGLILTKLKPSYHLIAMFPLSLRVGYIFGVGSSILLLMVFGN